MTNSKSVLHERDQEKRNKYSEASVTAAIYAKLVELGHQVGSMEVYGLIFGARGAINPATFNLLLQLGMSKSRIGSIIDLVSRESLTIYRVFHSEDSVQAA